MCRLAALLFLALLASCVPGAPPGTTSPASVGVPFAPSSQADRGIGGTGAPGGTGGTSGLTQSAERGIGGTGTPGGTGAPGGTGIVGVITGFGSIFVDGLEIGYDSATPVDIDGASGSANALRVGQVVAIEAEGPPSALKARNVAVRYQVSGPVDALTESGQMLHVAGQSVAIDSRLAGNASLQPGAWVAVSGLRRPDGTIVATRIDPRPAGRVSVRGLLVRGPDGRLGIGGLHLAPAPGLAALDGQYVQVSGSYADGRLTPRSVAPDRVASDPFAHFGPHVQRLVVESYFHAEGGRLRTAAGFSVPTSAGMPAGAMTPGWGVLHLERTRGGHPHAVGFRAIGGPGEAPSGRLGPRGQIATPPTFGGRRYYDTGPAAGREPAPLAPGQSHAPGYGIAPREPKPWQHPEGGRAHPACHPPADCRPAGERVHGPEAMPSR